MKKIAIFGHKNPDTDTVCSSIALSYLKNKLGMVTEPKVLGHINKESKYVLDYFGVKEPEYLNNVNIQIRNVHYDKNVMISENKSIADCFSVMQERGINAIPIVNDEKKLTGFVTLKEIAMLFLCGKKDYLNTTTEILLKSLDGKILVRHHDSIKGNIIAGSYYSVTFVNEIILTGNDILIVGDRYKIIRHAIEQGVKCIIVTGNHILPEELISLASLNNVTMISTPLDTYNTSNAITMSNLVSTLKFNEDPIVVHDIDYLKDFISLSNKCGHTNYPIINKRGKCLGLLKVTDASKYDKKEVILVDHNSIDQSVTGIEDADIVEIIDHHNLGAIGTSMPINFRSKPVGCTCTIIYELYQENNIEIPREIAGIMLSAVLSDTLIFKSPTTTEIDKQVAYDLAGIAEIDLESYGMKMLKEASSIKGMAIEDIIFQDFKKYKVGDKTIGISQVVTMDYDEVEKNIDAYVEKINSLNNSYDLVTVFFTDVIKDGSYVLYNKGIEDVLIDSFNLNEIQEGTYLEGIISRKKQMLPKIMDNIDKLN